MKLEDAWRAGMLTFVFTLLIVSTTIQPLQDQIDELKAKQDSCAVMDTTFNG